MKKYLLISLIFSFQLVIFNLKAQVIITQPVVPVANKAVTIFFNASKGTGGLAGYTGTVYAHTGVITNKSLNSTDWKYVNCNDPLAVWGYNKPELQLTHVSGDIWSLELTPNIREFYGVPAEESILQLAFVFRSGEIPVGATSFLEGKDEGWRDIFVDVSESDFNVKIISPVTNSLFVQGQNIPITVACDEMAKIQLAINNIWVDSIATDTLLPHTFQNVQRGFYTLKARASVGSKVQYDSITILVRGTTEVAAVPDGLKDGINYYSNDPTKVTLVLVAPGKDHIFVVGDFNDWQLRLEGQMKRGTRSYQNWKTDFGWGVQPYNYDCYWLTIEGLVPGREYRFQYIVDDSIWTTDPYSELVYDPYNDQYISETTFPNMPTYPNKASIYSLCGTFKTNETQYPWQVNNFVTPNKDKLVIYELLFRDFMSDYGFEQLRDSLDYLQRLGVNAIEFMPMFEFDGNESWGYAPSFYFAPDKNYGTKNNLKKLIDECHRRGIAVILDVVFNHLWGNSPTAQLWWDKAGNQTTDDNPYHFNYVVHPYSVGSDLNHNSPLVNELVKRALKHYLLEYHIDGFRFDLSKGIMGVGYNTGSPCGSDADCGDWVCGEDMGCWNQYNPNRIAILKYYNNYIRSIKSNAFVILEHLAEDQEESDLAGQGMYSWKKVADPFKQLAMGYATGSDIQAAKNKWRVVYMESHDEERLPAEMKKWGNQCFDGCNNGQNYDTRDTLTLPQKMEAVYTLLLTMPGPKMIWQFGELAYDYSIEKCQGEYGMIKPKLDGQGNPVVDTEGRPVYDTFPYHSDCRVDKKPVRWDYFEQPARKVLYEKVSKLNYFHANYPALNNIDPYGADFYIGAKNGDDNSLQKWVYCKKGDDGFIAITNNDIAPQDLY
ncbi:MAG: hypothetical protein LBC89_05920, partial [Bacteroidales bacterium]|nr:hypothetical protein [Bacteroidales bacterium]